MKISRQRAGSCIAAGLIALGILLAILATPGCSPTITRQEVHQRQASWTATGQDSGILSDSKDLGGFTVNKEWVNGYQSLLERYGQTLSPPRKIGDMDGIKTEGDHFRITDAVLERHLTMNARRVNDQKP